MAIHIFDTTGEAYDACQCDESVNKGDILFIPSEGVVGLADTWPIAITKAYGDLHTATAASELEGDAAILATVKYLTDAHLVEKHKRMSLVDVQGDALIVQRPGAGRITIADRYGDPLDHFTIEEFDQILLEGREVHNNQLIINW
jgi:hypothetical protein